MRFIFALLTALYLTGCAEVIDTGHRGVEVNYGEVVGDPLPEGFYWYNPFSTDIVEMDTRTQALMFTSVAYTKDMQQATFLTTLNFNIDQAAVTSVYKDVGMDWQNKLLPQVVHSSLKDTVGKWNAEELVSNRDRAKSEIQAKVTEALLKKRIIVTSLDITNIDFTEAFERAIEAKVVAVQNALAEQNRTKQVEEKARQTVASAEAEAESMRIRANALEANPKLVDYEAVQKWDGKMPQYMLGGSGLMFNIGGK